MSSPLLDTVAVAADAADHGSGRARGAGLRGAPWVRVDCVTPGPLLQLLCRAAPARGWGSGAAGAGAHGRVVAVDALVWRTDPSSDSSNNGAVVGARDPRVLLWRVGSLPVSALVPLTAGSGAAACVTLVAPRTVPLWRRSSSAQERFWAAQVARALLEGHLVGVGWHLNAGPLLGQLRVARVQGELCAEGYALVSAATEVEVVREAAAVPAGVPLGGAEDKLRALASFVLDSRKRVLLHGMPGCGKTHLVRALCSRLALRLFELDCEDVDGSALQETFDEARAELQQEAAATVLVLLDHVDRLPGAAVAHLLRSMDSASRVAVVGAAVDADAVDSALRRPGRFDVEFVVHAPRASERQAIVEAHMATAPAGVGELTIGMTCADLVALCWRARESGWETALLQMPRTGLDRGVEEVPHKAWDDIGGLDAVKQRIRQAIEWPILHSERMARMGLSAARGVLLHGPPGCAKTSLVRALATNLKASFFVLTAASVYSPWVGAAEQMVREVFERARNFPPAIIFIDEMEAVVGKREHDPTDASSKVQERVLSTLLNEMDGVEETKSVVVVGATNRVDRIDEALLRPGRFDHVLEVPLPDVEARLAILRVYLKRMPLDAGVDASLLAQRTDGWSGAELEALCTEAGLFALRQAIASGHEDSASLQMLTVATAHFEAALAARPSVY